MTVAAGAGGDRPLVSVVIPAYNHARYLEEAFASIWSQTLRSWEVVLVDDGSTDDTPGEFVRLVGDDNRFRYIRQQNAGLPSARNSGIRVARGDFVQLLDADDIIDPAKLEMQVDALRSSPAADIAYCGYLCFADGNPGDTWVHSRVQFEGDVAQDLARNWEKVLSIPPHSFLYRRAVFERFGLFDELFVKGKEDWDFLLSTALQGASFTFVPGTMARYRVSQTSMVRSAPRKMAQGRRMLYRKYILSPQSRPDIRRILARRYVEDLLVVRAAKRLRALLTPS